MNTDRNRHINPFWPALSVMCYWVFVGVLAMLLATAMESDNIHGKASTLAASADKPATGAGNSSDKHENTGSSSDENSDGSGAAQEDNDGTDNGTQAEGDTGSNGEKSDLEQSPDANQDYADDDEEQVDVMQGDENATSKSKLFSNEPIISTSNSPQPPDGENTPKKRILNLLPKERESKPEAQKGKVLLKASQAGKMKGFFGSGSISGNVMFIVDVSSSMTMRSPEGFVRLELLKRELRKVLEDKLDELDKGKRPDGKFSIIAFSHITNFYPSNKKSYSFKDRRDIKEALEVVDNLNADGGTEMRLAWHEAKPLFKSLNIKCVYFLTDGEDPCFSAQNVEDVKIRINTFALGVHSPVLEEIAKKHKGKYTEVY